MFRAILFDLDGTLLDIDVESFLKDYFSALGPVVAAVTGENDGVEQSLAAVMRSTDAMCREHHGVSNREVFNARFLELTGADLEHPIAADLIARFYADTFPGLRGTHGPRPGGLAALEAARDSGMPIALATNPIFPRVAILERMRWADLDIESFDVITSYETMHACKPAPDYFLQTAQMLGVDARDCLMVGDDPDLDLAAADVGMRTFYVGNGERRHADWHGDLYDLKRLLSDLGPVTS